MKKISLFMILTMIGTMGFAQVIFQIQAPSTPVPLQNTTYPLTWADPAGGDWATPDLNIPANSVTAALQFVDDGDAPTLDANGNPLNEDACTPLINGAALAGKIAVLYRGACEFGMKARHAENAGAVGVIIINHTGAPVGMAGGDSGTVVTIPLIMISEQDGDMLKADIAAGTIVQAFIGNKFGIFVDDLGSKKGDVMRARRYSNLANLSQNASEFSVPVGAWVRNYGSATQAGGTVNVTIDNGTQIYNQTGNVPTLNSGDSAFVALPLFSQASYPVGVYTMTYTIAPATPDLEPSDNIIDASFEINDSLYSYSRLDAQGVPLSPAGFRSGGFTTDWEGCFAFNDPNGSRATSLGMTISASTSSPVLLTNEFVEIRVYQWDDVFTDINDPGLNFSVLTSLDAAFFVFPSDLQDIPVFIPHSSPIPLSDNQRYLFCLNSPSQEIFAGYDSEIDYLNTIDDGVLGANGAHLQPSIPGAADGTYFLNGFGTDVQLAASVQMSVLVGVDELENETSIVTFPNPTNDVVNIPVGDRNGSATIELFDIAGKLVISKKVTFSKNEILTLDVSTLGNGSYVANMIFEDATTVKFNVVVSK